MPNDHVMCLVVWRELYSCLSHSFSKTETQQDQQVDDEIDNMSDELVDGSIAAGNIQHNTPFVMETIQQRVKQLVNAPITSVLTKSSQVLINQSKEETDEHTSIESADNSLHQVA